MDSNTTYRAVSVTDSRRSIAPLFPGALPSMSKHTQSVYRSPVSVSEGEEEGGKKKQNRISVKYEETVIDTTGTVRGAQLVFHNA